MRRWVILLLLGFAPAVLGGVVDSAQRNASAAAHPWSVAGGDIGVRWDTDVLGNLGMTLEAKPAGVTGRVDRGNHEWFTLGDPALEFGVVNNTVEVFTGGALQMRGGYVLDLHDGSRIDLRDAQIRPSPGLPKVFDVVSSDGKVWFRIDHPMYDLKVDQHIFVVHAADVRASQALAERLHSPTVAGQYLGGVAWTTNVVAAGSNALPETVCDPFPWPNVPVPPGPGVPAGATYQQDLFMDDFPAINVVGCSTSTVGVGHCDGPGGDDGIVSYTLATQLKDNVNSGSMQPTIPGDPLGTSTALYAATIAWYQMFNPDQSPPNSPQPPYNNDQHAYILWNLYRINADGSVEQIGRSGLKHAYHANTGGSCLDNCNSSHALGRGCTDQYSTGDNDNPLNMGPRSEVVPATGIWGRCGSIWDTQCTGNQQPADPPGNPYGNGNDSWTRRMKTHESQLDPGVNPGATYLIEAWYVARDDIDIYNSMATEQITPTWVNGSPGAWLPLNPTGYRLGPAIDRWVDPTSPPGNAQTTELAPAEGGHTKVAVKTTDLGNGSWRYDYAVMNLDYSRAVVVPQENGPDPRVVSNLGFDSFSIPLPAGSVVSATSFRDNTNMGDQPWAVTVGSNSVTWSSAGTTLDWGSMYAFSVTTNAVPGSGSSTLHVAQAGTPASYDVATLVPGGAVIPQPQVAVSPTSVEVDVVQGGSASTVLTIGNTGAAGSTLNYALASSSSTCTNPAAVPWLGIAPASGAIPAGGTTPATLTVDASTLAPGTYAVSVCVNSNDPAQPQIVVPLTATVQAAPAPAVAVAPSQFTFSVMQGGTSSQNLTISNVGDAGTTLSFAVVSSSSTCTNPVSVPWLGISPASGDVAAGSSASVTLSVDASALTPNTYAVSVCMTSNDPTQPLISIPVTVVVHSEPEPLAAITPSQFTFNLVQGGSSSQTLSISNAGDAGTTLTFDISISTASPSDCTQPDNPSWLGVVPATGSVVANAAPALIAVDANAETLATGNYAASLCVATSDPLHALFEVPVNLTVSQSDTIFENGFEAP